MGLVLSLSMNGERRVRILDERSGEAIWIELIEVDRGKFRLHFTAARHYLIDRGAVVEQKERDMIGEGKP